MQQGVAPAVYLAAAPEAGTVTGAYYGPPRKREAVNPIAEDVRAQDRLWDLSLEQVGLSEKTTSAEVAGGLRR